MIFNARMLGLMGVVAVAAALGVTVFARSAPASPTVTVYKSPT